MCGLQHYQQEGQKCIVHPCRINVGGSGRKGKIMNGYQLLDQLDGSQPYNEMRILEKEVVLEENQGLCFGHHIQLELITRYPSGEVRQAFDSYLLTYLSSLNARTQSFSSFFVIYAVREVAGLDLKSLVLCNSLVIMDSCCVSLSPPLVKHIIIFVAYVP